MAIKFPPPPKDLKNAEETIQWLLTCYNFVRGSIQLVNDAAATIGSGTTYVGVTALTAPRTLTLPDSSLLQDGDKIVVQDESGGAGTHAITIVRSGTDTINTISSTTITSNNGRKTIIKRGTGTYFAA